MLSGKYKSNQEAKFDFMAPEEAPNAHSLSPEKRELYQNALKAKFMFISNRMGIDLVDFAHEEDRDRDSVRIALLKYNPLFT